MARRAASASDHGHGPGHNILLAVVLVAVINGVGTQVPAFLDEKPVIGQIAPGSPAEQAGLRVDDEILSIAGRPVKTWSDVELAVGSRPDRLVRSESSGTPDRAHRPQAETVTKYHMG